MKSALFVAAAAATMAAAGVVGGVVAAPAPQAASAAAPKIDNFQLTDNIRYGHDFYYYKYAPAIVVMSQVNGTDASRAAAKTLEKLSAEYKSKGVVFFMINSTDARDAIMAEAKTQGYKVPVLIDELQLVGENMKIDREGEVFVVDPKTWRVAFRGPAADAGVKKAVDAVSAGSAPAFTQVAVKSGRQIAFATRGKEAEFARISYAKDIAPIINEKCSTCHVSGGIGPFVLDSYEVVKGYAPMIRETVRTKRMPPYFADPHIGTFKNDQGMTAAQTQKLVHWIEAGAPRGEGADPLLANKGKVAPEWPEYLGKPDVIVEIPAFNVPSTGIVEYQNQRVENPFKDDTFLRAISIKPGDRRVLHHVVSNHVAEPGRARTIPGGSVGSYTPGAEAQVMADGAGAPVPGGGKLNFQMHYTTIGKESTDKTQVGFYVMKEKPEFIKRSIVIGDFALRIPAGEARHGETAYLTFPADAELYTLYPHAHYRGRNVELKMIEPDGKETMLISLPKYDFNWQRDYDPVVPIKVKAGTKLVAYWEYDNSANNFANPDPKRDITWGEQTHEEMMYFRVNFRFMDETVSKQRNDLQNALQASLQLGALDDNLNGKIELSELSRPNVASIKAKFAEMDANKDGSLDAKEFSNINARGMARGRPADVEIPDL